MITRNFPKTRARRLRKNSVIRDLISETSLNHKKLIQPLFVSDTVKGVEEISSMPNQFRFDQNSVLKEIEELKGLGINTIALFPHLKSIKKDNEGSEALSPENFLCDTLKKIKQHFPDLVVIVDVALDPYTTSGHDGILKDGKVDNDLTLDALSKMSITLTHSGADILAPSDMMDGRIGYIRDELEKNDFKDTVILSYAVKYASSYYGPFRDAVGSKQKEGISKKTYQMDFRNSKEARKEVELDIQEGADILMVKPALPNLDVIKVVSEEYDLPVFAYQVSGEYSMLMNGIDKNLFDSNVIPETLVSIFRAGSSSVLTYFAKWIAENNG